MTILILGENEIIPAGPQTARIILRYTKGTHTWKVEKDWTGKLGETTTIPFAMEMDGMRR